MKSTIFVLQIPKLMSTIKILLTDNCHHVLKQKLETAGISCDEFFTDSKEKLLNCIHQYNGVVVRSKFIVDKQFIDSGIRLKCIGRLGSGMETIDVEYAEKKGITCLNSPEGNRDAVGEHTLAMLLGLFNHLNKINNEIKQGLWRREANRGLELKGKTVGIMGYGNMGAAFAKRLQGFDVETLAYDKYKTRFSDNYAKKVDLKTLFENADILSLHVPLTEETHYMVDNKFLQSFKKDIYLINTSRGKVIKTSDLVDKLKLGKVKGSCLDVLEYENMIMDKLDPEALGEDFKYLIHADNVLLSPHVAGWTVESKYKLADVLATKIINVFILDE